VAAVPIVLETLRPGDEAAVRDWVNDGHKIYFLNPDTVPPEMAELTKLAADGHIAHLAIANPLYVNNDASVAPAIEAIDRIYDDHVLSHDNNSTTLAELYESPDIHLAYKKQVLEDLCRSTHCRMLLEQIATALPKVPARFVPAAPIDAALMERYDVALGEQARPRCTLETKTANAGQRALRKRDLRACALVLYVAGRALSSWLRGLFSSPDRRRFTYAVSIVSPVREFANRYRAPDALLDGKALTRDNTLFVPLEPLTDGQRDELKERGLHTAIPHFHAPTGLTLRILTRAPILALRLLFTPGWTAPATATLFKEYWIWSVFTSVYGVSRFLTHGDVHYRHVGRNVLLNRSGTETWYYLDTENLGALNLVKDNAPANLHPFWSFLYYDRLLTWSQRLIDYYRQHKQKVGRYDAIGVVWSDPIRELRESGRGPELAKTLCGSALKPGRKIIAVFDSSYVNLSRTTYEDGAQFGAAFERLLEEMPDIILLWKEKKDRSVHPRQGSYGLLDIYKRLADHPRCRFLGYQTPSEEVLAAADLCVCFPFTSSAAEMMSAGGRGMYYAPNDKFAGSFFSGMPGVVAHNYAELSSLVRKTVFATSDSEYQAFLEAEIRGKIAPELDGKGLARLRQMFSGQ
jgi:polysaccharide biosynthesis PFTS motif protein